MTIISAPFIHQDNHVSSIMLNLILALLPGIAVATYFFGWGMIVNILLACLTAIICEISISRLRDQPFNAQTRDNSGLVTAVLLAIAIPPLSPWWLIVIGTFFAIVIAKQLYGGLGNNPFNPAMLGYAVLLISFPIEMTAWTDPNILIHKGISFADTFSHIFSTPLMIDAYSSATPLDIITTRNENSPSLEVLQQNNLFGFLGGKGWEQINLAFLIGGLWMLYKRIIQWQIPVAFLACLFLLSFIANIMQPELFTTPLFHLFSGGTMLCAFFIATDPVTASTTIKGRLIYGAGIAVFVFIIRAWGGYPDGIAFAILLMNTTVPLIDYYTQPIVFGSQDK